MRKTTNTLSEAFGVLVEHNNYDLARALHENTSLIMISTFDTMSWAGKGGFQLMRETGCQRRWVKCQKVSFSFDAVSKIALEETADSNQRQLKDKLTIPSSSNTAFDANNAFTNLQCVEFSSLFYRIIVIISIEEPIKTFAGPESQLLKLWLDAQFFCWHRGHDYLKM